VNSSSDRCETDEKYMLSNNMNFERAWLAQGSMNYFDITHYVQDYPIVYLSVNIAKHQREMSVGDPIFIWRAKGQSKDISGVIAFGKIVETCTRLDQVKFHQHLLPIDRNKRVDAPGKDLKVGIEILERRLTPEEGMVVREAVANHPLLGQTAIIKAGTGSTFSLSKDRFSAYCDLWNCPSRKKLGMSLSKTVKLKSEKPELFEPTSDNEKLEANTSRLLESGLDEEPVGNLTPERSEPRESKGAFKRDPEVIAWVKQRAVGICELCEKKGPFLDKDNQPFLEVHHILPLSDDGADTVDNAVALCPNCHRECHYGQNTEALKLTLLKKIQP
jgi:hypothetical protein